MQTMTQPSDFDHLQREFNKMRKSLEKQTHLSLNELEAIWHLMRRCYQLATEQDQRQFIAMTHVYWRECRTLFESHTNTKIDLPDDIMSPSDIKNPPSPVVPPLKPYVLTPEDRVILKELSISPD